MTDLYGLGWARVTAPAKPDGNAVRLVESAGRVCAASIEAKPAANSTVVKIFFINAVFMLIKLVLSVNTKFILAGLLYNFVVTKIFA